MPQVSNFSWMNMFFFSLFVFLFILIMISFFLSNYSKSNFVNLNKFNFYFLL